MNVRNCRKCRKLFNYISGMPLCPACKEEMEAKFQEVKKYIQDHRNCTIAQVSEECDVEEAQIRQWVREERLEFGEGSVAGITCETCGTAILTGRFCDRCKASMISGLQAAGRRPEAARPQPSQRDNGNKMRFLNH